MRDRVLFHFYERYLTPKHVTLLLKHTASRKEKGSNKCCADIRDIFLLNCTDVAACTIHANLCFQKKNSSSFVNIFYPSLYLIGISNYDKFKNCSKKVFPVILASRNKYNSTFILIVFYAWQ